MSNTRKLTTIHGNGAFPSRPKSQWRGFRMPRSVIRRHEVEVAIQRARKSAQHLSLPEQPDPNTPVVCAATGLILSPYNHALTGCNCKEENVA